MARYRLIDEHRTPWSIKEMCRVLEVSRSGFYAWKNRVESTRSLETRRLDVAIERIYQTSEKCSGSLQEGFYKMNNAAGLLPLPHYSF